jgi:hypothetical protein
MASCRSDFGTWMPDNIIRAGVNLRGQWVVQFIPPHLYAIAFGHAQIIVPLPALVFAAIGTSYYLWAIKEKMFTAKALAYHAPLPNISAAGKLCFGSNRPPDRCHEQDRTGKADVF